MDPLRAVKAVKLLEDAGIPVSLSYTVTAENVDYVVDFVKLAARLKVPVVTFVRVQEFGRAAGGGLGISNELAHRALLRLSEVGDLGVRVVFSGFRFGVRVWWLLVIVLLILSFFFLPLRRVLILHRANTWELTQTPLHTLVNPRTTAYKALCTRGA